MTPKQQEKLNACTVLVTGIDAAIIKSTARQTFTVDMTTIVTGQQFFLVRSSSDATRYYVVSFSDVRHDWQCSCGAGTKKHAHTTAVKAWVIEHVVRPREAVIMSTPVIPAIQRLPRAEAFVREMPKTEQPVIIDNGARGQLNGVRMPVPVSPAMSASEARLSYCGLMR